MSDAFYVEVPDLSRLSFTGTVRCDADGGARMTLSPLPVPTMRVPVQGLPAHGDADEPAVRGPG